MKRGLFITFEGGEGAGKSTQVKLLSEKLAPCLTTREPGGTPKAEILRAFILSGKAKAWGAECEAVLFAAARLHHVETRIQPALEGGKHVICDRFIDSTYVYQGMNGGLPRSFLDNLTLAACGNTLPDLTFILDLPPELGLARALSRNQGKDRFESEALDFHTRLRNGFLAQAHLYPTRCIVIDATQNIEMIRETIWASVKVRLK